MCVLGPFPACRINFGLKFPLNAGIPMHHSGMLCCRVVLCLASASCGPQNIGLVYFAHSWLCLYAKSSLTSPYLLPLKQGWRL
jgi:hypothetical protein